jgi:hypothetical protein
MHFGENQLSRSLIGLSPLPTDHPPGFQPWWVRASTPSYRRFTLPMGRSPRFGSAARDSNALFGLAFATAPPHGLTSPHTTTRRLILQKARHHPTPPPKDRREALTACRHTVSGTLSQPLTGALFTFPSRYWSAIGHQEVFRLTTWSWQIHTELHGLRATRGHYKEDARVSPTGLSPSTAGHPRPFDYPNALSLPAHTAAWTSRTPQPHARNTCRLSTRTRFSHQSPFAHHYSGNHNLFSLPAGTEMFHFPAFPPTALYIQTAATPHNECQVTPFGNPRITAWLPATRGISQAPTSFIGS